jgi:hypothetical protein
MQYGPSDYAAGDVSPDEGPSRSRGVFEGLSSLDRPEKTQFACSRKYDGKVCSLSRASSAFLPTRGSGTGGSGDIRLRVLSFEATRVRPQETGLRLLLYVLKQSEARSAVKAQLYHIELPKVYAFSLIQPWAAICLADFFLSGSSVLDYHRLDCLGCSLAIAQEELTFARLFGKVLSQRSMGISG